MAIMLIKQKLFNNTLNNFINCFIIFFLRKIFSHIINRLDTLKKIFSFAGTFLLLFPCLLSAKNMAVLETLSPQDSLTMQERLYLTDILRNQAVSTLPAEQNWTIMAPENINVTLPPGETIENCKGNCLAEIGKNNAADYVVQARISQFDKSLAITAELYETESSKLIASFVGKGESVEDIEKIIKEQSPDFFKKVLVNEPRTTGTKDDETRPKADSTYAELDSNKKALDELKTGTSATNVMAKRFWGGTTVGLTYNDFHSTHFGLKNIKHKSDYKITVNGSDDLLNSFWGIGFRIGMSGLFIPSPYFSLHGDLALALRQGTGKTNLSVMLAWPDAERAKQKSDLKIEYSATQLNIDMPILARVSIPNALYFEAGPMVSFNVYSKSKAEITDIFGTETYEENGDLSVAEFDIVTGVGVTQSIGKSMIDFDLRFVIGLTRISDGKDSPKTWQGQLNVTYWFL